MGNGHALHVQHRTCTHIVTYIYLYFFPRSLVNDLVLISYFLLGRCNIYSILFTNDH